jgi:hypothetical protein
VADARPRSGGPGSELMECRMARLSEDEREEAREDWQEHRDVMQENRQDFVNDQLDEHADGDDDD